jgi:5'-nucleotidase
VLPSSTLRRGDGHRVQSKVTVTLLEYQGLTASRTAADSVRSGLIATNIATGATHRNPTVSKYTVVKGDTLQKIAARKLGNSNRWTEIAKLNGIKDPIHLKVGAKINLPAK